MISGVFGIMKEQIGPMITTILKIPIPQGEGTKQKVELIAKVVGIISEFLNPMSTVLEMLNKQEADRRIAQGESVPDKPQYVMFEHDIAMRAPLWDKVKGANNPSNTFVNQNPRARRFKDDIESWFYTKIKTMLKK